MTHRESPFKHTTDTASGSILILSTKALGGRVEWFPFVFGVTITTLLIILIGMEGSKLRFPKGA